MYNFQDTNVPLEERVVDLLGQLELEEKIALLPSNQKAVPRLDIKEYFAGAEGAHGIVDRNGGQATVFPQPYGLSCTWDTDLLGDVGRVIGDEARAYFALSEQKSFLTLFFPTIDMERDPRWGRNEEAYGEDPFLAGKLASSLIRGVQGADPFYVRACASPKHFYANNFERDRSFTDSIVSPRLKYEYYLKVFAYAFEEGKALSLMTAYNKINGVPGMLNPELNTIVRDLWKCEGYFVTDGAAFRLALTEHKYAETYAQIFAGALKAGINMFLDDVDLVIPAAHEALEQHLVSEEEIDKALSPMLRVRFRLGHFDKDTSKNPYAGITQAILCSKEHAAVARRAAQEAVVLLKNDGLLPLSPKTKKIAVIGQLGNENMPDWYSGNPPYTVTPLEGIKRNFTDAEVIYADGCDICCLYNKRKRAWVRVLQDGSVTFDGNEKHKALFRRSDWGYGGFGFYHSETKKYLTTTEEGECLCNSDALWGWFTRELFFCTDNAFLPEQARGNTDELGVAARRGDSVYNKPYAQGALDKINAFLQDLEIVKIADGAAHAAQSAAGADAVVVVVGNHSLIGARECIDRESLALPEHMAALVQAAAELNSHVILTIISGYPYALKPYENLAQAILFTTHGAQELGTAIGDVLVGAYNPAGRLSQTWYHDEGDLPDINDYNIIKNKCTYLYCNKPVLYPFGYGLSYTTFSYDGLAVSRVEGGVRVSFTVKNTGEQAGEEVVQVYTAFTSQHSAVTQDGTQELEHPIKQLCGFKRLPLAEGEEKALSFIVPMKELSFYHEEFNALVLESGEYRNAFVPESGEYRFMVGGSSAEIQASEAILL
ncbi:MAG: glycoside hydrolase family 3 C-terminal domain-containing protein [Spirochaetaceae bacterium]|jgi:beta-glucosidase|nr:glycoside hydrolase family 3 C-terminal domain-containing protein [Spirochaetaceae bacterium]